MKIVFTCSSPSCWTFVWIFSKISVYLISLRRSPNCSCVCSRRTLMFSSWMYLNSSSMDELSRLYLLPFLKRASTTGVKRSCWIRREIKEKNFSSLPEWWACCKYHRLCQQFGEEVWGPKVKGMCDEIEWASSLVSKYLCASDDSLYDKCDSQPSSLTAPWL